MDPWGLNAVSIAKGALIMVAIDTMTPDPTDAALPKWIAWSAWSCCNGCRCIIGKRYMYRKMPGNTIVDGNHRMVAGLLCNQIPASTPGTAPLSKLRIPLKDIQPDPIDWW